MRKFTDGILSFQDSHKQSNGGKIVIRDQDKAEVPQTEDLKKSNLSRRGARLAFDQLSAKFGPRLLTVLPNMWQSMTGGLFSAFLCGRLSQVASLRVLTILIESPKDADILIEEQYGQDVIDSFSVLEAVVPTFHQDLWPRLAETFKVMELALHSRFAIIRQSAARCFATICDVMTSDAMHFVVEHIIPLIGDPLVLAHRQGATELVYRQSLSPPVISLFTYSCRYCSTPRYQGPPICHLHGCSGTWTHERYGRGHSVNCHQHIRFAGENGTLRGQNLRHYVLCMLNTTRTGWPSRSARLFGRDAQTSGKRTKIFNAIT